MRFGKRLFDMVVSLVALALLSPIILIVAILVRIKLGNPVLFRQTRPGLGSRLFDMVKFRSMREAFDADGNPLPDGERLPRFGKWLRSSSLDELPGLWNVLKGEMSLVGPRPLLVKYLPYYTEREQLRHAVRPGVTGWAQIHGRADLPWDQRLELDAWYVEHCSLRLDLKIMVLTVGKVLRRENTGNEAAPSVGDFDQERRERMAALQGAHL
ncbi:MAG: sugar transferase [Gemmataceae bacterium]|nr:sugar transferase [Gemmataceae bacterium]